MSKYLQRRQDSRLDLDGGHFEYAFVQLDCNWHDRSTWK